MKRSLKVICILLSLTVILTSCSIGRSSKILDRISTLLEENKFNECRQYISELKPEEIAEINNDACKLIAEKFTGITESHSVDLKKLYILSAYDNEYAESCRSLWNIAELLTVTPENTDFDSFIHLKYFAEVSNYAQYREIYALMESVNNNGYLKKVDAVLTSYDSDGDYSGFESAYSAACAYDCGQFDPQQYLVSDYRNAHNNIVKNLKSASNGFASDDPTVVAKAINELENSLTTVLHIADLIKAINAKQISIFSALSNEKNLYREFKTDIEESTREYSPGTGLDLDSVFGRASGFIDETDIEPDGENTQQSISAEEALNIAVNAINKTKQYQGKVNVSLTEQRNVQMTSFATDTKITSSLEITKSQINNILKQKNGTYKTSVEFTNGTGNSKNLYDFIPPEGKNAAIATETVESYTAVAGSGGYVITFVLKSCETNKSNPDFANGALINGFILDKTEGINDFKSFYAPSSVMLMINSNGMLLKYQYSVSGICDCTFLSGESNETATADFSFDNKYLYEFVY
ncbi:MAG: hypothetical protein ACI4SX_03850 [Candidatus Fimenecus sp.]